MSQFAQSAARDRLSKLLDSGSFVEIGGNVSARYNVAESGSNGDGAVTGYGTINGALVYVYAQDPGFLGGSIGEMHAKKISNIYNMAINMGAPVIALVDCAGVRLNEGNDSLFSFGRLFSHQAKASGIVPQITAVFGSCGGGMAVSASMSDFVFMESKDAKLFLNSPNAVEGNYEEKTDTSSAKYQAEKTGLVDFAGTEDEIYAAIRDLVQMIPQNNEEDFSFEVCEDDLNRSVAGIESLKEKSEVLAQISDDGKIFEIKKDHASCMTAAFIRINGRTVGAVATNAKKLCHFGVKKAIKFLNFCDAFNIPVLTLTDVDGFKRNEVNEQNLARALGKLTYTYANLTVPSVTVVTGDAYGTAGIVMNSKAIGADVVYAWTGAKMGLMDKDLLAKITDAVDKDVNAAVYNAKRGYVDDIIEPAETRQSVAAAFEMLYSKSVQGMPKKHGTV